MARDNYHHNNYVVLTPVVCFVLQVDLMHRCLYSVVHHDDMVDLKMVLETSLGHLVTHFDHQGNQVCITG